MSVFEEQPVLEQKKRDPDTLSDNQYMVYMSIKEPVRLAVLYEVHKERMPSSSVRRILQSLRDDGLCVKINKKEWQAIPYV